MVVRARKPWHWRTPTRLSASGRIWSWRRALRLRRRWSSAGGHARRTVRSERHMQRHADLHAGVRAQLRGKPFAARRVRGDRPPAVACRRRSDDARRSERPAILLEPADAYGIGATRLPREPLRRAPRFSRRHRDESCSRERVSRFVERRRLVHGGHGAASATMFGMHQPDSCPRPIPRRHRPAPCRTTERHSTRRSTTTRRDAGGRWITTGGESRRRRPVRVCVRRWMVPVPS